MSTVSKDSTIIELEEDDHLLPLLKLKPVIIKIKKSRKPRKPRQKKRKLTKSNMIDFVFVEGNRIRQSEKVKDWLTRNNL